jgi:hypothetical protein
VTQKTTRFSIDGCLLAWRVSKEQFSTARIHTRSATLSDDDRAEHRKELWCMMKCEAIIMRLSNFFSLSRSLCFYHSRYLMIKLHTFFIMWMRKWERERCSVTLCREGKETRLLLSREYHQRAMSKEKVSLLCDDDDNVVKLECRHKKNLLNYFQN